MAWHRGHVAAIAFELSRQVLTSLSQTWSDAKCAYYLDWASQGNKTLVDRVQITRLDESILRWQIRDLRVSTSQLRYALRASEEQIQEVVNLKPGQQMIIDFYPGGV
jgi:hypothetical protein